MNERLELMNVEINDANIKLICKSAHAMKLHMILAEMYRDGAFNEPNIREVARLMDSFFNGQVTT